MKSTQLLTIVMAGALSSGIVMARSPERESRHERREEMRQWRQQMQEQVKAQDAELDKLQQQINSASGQQKVDALAAAVNALIQQRKQMHTQLESFRDRIEKERGGGAGMPGGESSPGAGASPGGAGSPGTESAPGAGSTPGGGTSTSPGAGSSPGTSPSGGSTPQ